MIFGHEGQPRSGKSYEAVLHHLLPALKAERHCFVRLNGVGEEVESIAQHLEMDVERVRELLHVMGNDEVHAWLVCDAKNDGSVLFPHIPSKSLVIVDECHEFWPIGRAGLPDPVANFFAKHGHVSLDVVLLTQDCKELHRSVVRRMQKKNFYTKLDALGSDASYSVKFYNATAPGKFEMMGSERRKYDPAVFALYHGVRPDVEGNEVYKANTRTLWQTAKKPAIVVVIALVSGVGALAWFFTGGMIPDPPEKPAKPVESSTTFQPETLDSVAPVQTVAAAVVPEPPKVLKPPGIEYVLDVKRQARARYLGEFGGRHFVEFRKEGQQQVMDRFTDAQLRELGWSVRATGYGLVVEYEDETLIFTAWPVDPIGQQSAVQTQALRDAGSPVRSLGDEQPAPGVAAGGGGVISNPGAPAYGAIAERPGIAPVGDMSAVSM